MRERKSLGKSDVRRAIYSIRPICGKYSYNRVVVTKLTALIGGMTADCAGNLK